jgi:hypothetical protein
MDRIKQILLPPLFLSLAAIVTAAWLGLIGYAAWQALFG